MGEELAYDIYLSTVVELDAWCIGFDPFDHNSLQRVYVKCRQHTLVIIGSAL